MNAEKSLATRNRVTQSNNLIEASYSLTLPEKRLLLIAISQLDSRKEMPQKETQISVRSYAELFNVTDQAAYMACKDAANSLFKREIRRRGPDGEIIRQRWVDHVRYRDGTATVFLSFSQHLHADLSDLAKGRFTSYTIGAIRQMRNVYSIRIFEMLWQYISVGKRFLDVEDLREKLELQDKYPLFSDFRRYIIEPAIKEINAKTNLQIDKPVPEKVGRVIVKIWFTFREKPQLPLDIPLTPN